MSRLELIAILFIIVLYLWWRVKRRIAEVKARFRGEPRQAARSGRVKHAENEPGALTLEKDPVTGVYRPPRG